MKLRAFKCKSCGAGLLFDFSSLSITCPYCGTAHVLERDDGEGADADVLPKGIIPYLVTPKDVEQVLAQWIAAGFWQPKSFKREAKIRDVKGFFLPVWTFDAKAHSNWSAQIGIVKQRKETYRAYDPTVKRNVNRQRIVRYTDWHSETGRHDGQHRKKPVLSSDGLFLLFDRIKAKSSFSDSEAFLNHYDFDMAVEFASEYFAGIAVDNTISDESEIEKRIAYTIRRDEEAACGRMARGCGDRYRGLTVNTTFEVIDRCLYYVPVYAAAVEFRGKKFFHAVSGQTAAVMFSGDRPVSVTKVSVATLLAVVAVMLALTWVWPENAASRFFLETWGTATGTAAGRNLAGGASASDPSRAAKDAQGGSPAPTKATSADGGLSISFNLALFDDPRFDVVQKKVLAGKKLADEDVVALSCPERKLLVTALFMRHGMMRFEKELGPEAIEVFRKKGWMPPEKGKVPELSPKDKANIRMLIIQEECSLDE